GVLANDTDVDGDRLTAVLVLGPSHGTLTLNSDGSFTYTPNADYNGLDGFVYQASDRTALSSLPGVNITLKAVNDPPVAADHVYAVDEDQTLTVKGPTATVLFLASQPGDFIGQGLTQTFTPANGSFRANRNFDNGVSLAYQGFAPSTDNWSLDFAAAGNVP